MAFDDMLGNPQFANIWDPSYIAAPLANKGILSSTDYQLIARDLRTVTTHDKQQVSILKNLFINFESVTISIFTKQIIKLFSLSKNA